MLTSHLLCSWSSKLATTFLIKNARVTGRGATFRVRYTLSTMFLEVFVSAAVFDELGSSRQQIWILIEGDWLNDIGGEEVHEWLYFMHLSVHRLWHCINHLK